MRPGVTRPRPASMRTQSAGNVTELASADSGPTQITRPSRIATAPAAINPSGAGDGSFIESTDAVLCTTTSAGPCVVVASADCGSNSISILSENVTYMPFCDGLADVMRNGSVCKRADGLRIFLSGI